MAEAAIVLAVGKLATAFGGVALDQLKALVTKEVALLVQELPGLAKRIERELDMIHNFLSQVGTRTNSNKVLEGWIVRVRKVAYRVEDIMDEYCYNIAHLQEEGYFKRLLHTSYYSTTFLGIAHALKDIDEEVKHLSQMKRDYQEMFNELLSNASEITQVRLLRDGSGHLTIGDDLVGMEEDMQLLDGWLDPKELARVVISVWGFGGLGKTSLVRKVYDWEREAKSFDCYSWVEVTQNYNIDVILRQLIRELCQDQGKIPADLGNMYRNKLIDALGAVLSDKKYLIVLDDVWDTRAFHDLSKYLIDHSKGSRIIITTRNSDVASLALEVYKLKLKPLGDEDAFELFCRRVFKSRNMQCPTHLENLSKKIVSKCGGLPLAINAIGNVLAVQEPTETAWRRMEDQFQCELEDNPGLDEVRSALSISFMYLPRHLKNCFLYCSIFPQDYVLSRDNLVKLWIAEGFISKRGNSTLEDVADGYLTDLIRGSMLQLVETDELGRVAFCKMHDIVRDIALSFSRKERFGLADVDLESEQKDDVRRLSISNYNQQMGSSMDLPHLRTFITTYGAADSKLLSTLVAKCKYLAVLEMQDSPIDTIPANIGDLFNLHYLGLRRTRVKSLPRSIERLSNLETLDLKSTEIEALPREITKLKKLRHLFAEKLIDPTRRQLRYFRGMELPSGFSHLEHLQTLETVEATKDTVELLSSLTELRTLWVENVRRSDCASLFASLSKIQHLSTLLISASSEVDVLNFDALKPEAMQLQKLIIRGCWDNGTFGLSVFRTHGPHIKYLALSCCMNGPDPIKVLSSNLPNLVYLSIRKGCCAVDVVLPAGGFPRLKTLFLGDMDQVQSMVIKEGALVGLEALYLVSLTGLKEVPKGLELVKSLKKLNVWRQHPEFKAEWERDEWSKKLHHVPEIRV